MTAVFFDPPFSDAERRTRLYSGELLVYSPVSSARELVEFARGLIVEAFGELDPRTAQYHMPVERYAALLAELKPKFIHHPRSKELLRAMLTELGCDPDRTYFDVPRMRTSTSDGYLTTGIAYAFHPHRDTWYSAPMCQLNWWLPIYPIRRDNGLAFHPRYWSRGVKNSSRLYDYDEWNRTSRWSAAEQIGIDRRVQPRAEEELDLADDLRILGEPGSVTIFSAAQLHSSVTNTSGRTRYSIDFRTVHRSDAERGRGAPNLDSRCTGTSLGDFLRCRDLARLPAELIAAHERGLGRQPWATPGGAS